MKKLLMLVAGAMSAMVAMAAEPSPLLIVDYNRDGKIDVADYERFAAGETFTVWLNDDDDDEGTDSGAEAGDTNNDLHDVPGGEGNDKDCADDKVNGRCDLLDFFPVLIDVNGVDGSGDYTWKLISKSVNVVFTQLKADTAGDFHAKEAKALDDETPLYEAEVEKLAGDDGKEEVELPKDRFLKNGRGVIIVEGAALEDGGLTLRGEKDGSDPVEVTLDLNVKNVEDMYGWMNLRDNSSVRLRLPTSTSSTSTSNLQPDNRHFILVHGYNTNPDEARGNAAEFYKKLYQSGSDAMFTAVEWKGDQSQIKFDLLGVNFSPNYHVNVENAFLAARPFADACRKLPGEKILVGHSLGNMLVSSAIKDYGLDYTKYVMLNAAVPREAFDASAYDEDMVPEDWLGVINRLDWASRWYGNFADHKYDPYEYRRKLAWRGRFANLPRTVNYYSPTDNILLNPDPNDPDPDKVFDPNDPEIYNKVRVLLAAKLVNGRSIGSGGSKKTGFGFWSFSEKMKGTWLLDVVNDVLTNVLEVAQADAYKCEGGWGTNVNYNAEATEFDPANTRFTQFLDERLKTQGMLDILPAETERLRAQHLADAIPAESFAAGANEVATVENVNEESFIGENPDWPLYEGEEVHTNLWNHSAFREVAFYHTSKFYASLAAVGKPRVIIDTDLGSSMDDLFTVDFAARMHHAGKLDLMAVMINRPDWCDPEGKGEFLTFADRYLALLGFEDLPIGKAKENPETLDARVFNPYWTLIYSNDVTNVGLLMPTNRTAEAIADLPDAVTLYRRLLNDAPDKSVVVCSTGFLTNLKALMESGKDYEGDDIYFTGLELIAAKVKELRIMGGCFDPASAPDGMFGAEYNAAGDPVAAKKVLEQWPTPVIVSPWEVGLKLYYKSDDVLADFPAGTFDPVIRAAYTYWPDPGPDAMNRLWDPMTVLPLTEGEALVPLSEKGGISVDEKGVTTFTPDPSSNRCYQVASEMDVEAVMNRLREIFCMGNPLADTVVYGTIRTAEKDNPLAEAIAIRDGKYIYVGNEKGASKLIDEDTKIIDHRGKGMVMPGCTDGHSHYPMKFGMDSMKDGVMFDLADSKANVLEKLKAATSRAKEKGRKTLFGFGWNIITLLVKEQPTLAELDEATGDISTVIFDQSGHHCFCNSKCLKRCGIIDGEGKVLINKIDGGVLELDEKGYPTGLAEERVTGYFMRMGGIDYDEVMDDEVAKAAILETQKFLLSTGYTTALEGWSNMLHTNKLYEAAHCMDTNGELKIVFPMTYEVEPWQTNIDDEITYLDSLNKTYRTRHVLPEYLKVFMDGVVETRTGAMINPYKDGTVYKSFWSVDRLADITAECNAKGLTVHTHTMGDAAIRDTVDAYIQGGDGTHRNCLVHLRNVSKEDFQRFAANNIACTAGFTWHISNEKEFNDLVSEFLDDEYLYHAYPMKSFFDAGVKVSSHSDFPANIPCPQDPFGIMEVAVTGQMPDDPTGEMLPAYDEDELVTRTRAFEALTINGAWQLGLENERGSIKVGKWADFVLTDQDVFECAATDIGETKVVSTWFEGEKVFEAPLGSKANPWEIGAEVTAYISGVDTLVVKGKGAIGSTPWAGSAAGITKLVKDDGVESTEALVKSLPALTNINGLTRDQFTSAAIGFVKADGFSAIEVTGGKATLDVVVSRAPSLDKPVEWTPVSTNKVEVSAPGEQGFFIVAPAE